MTGENIVLNGYQGDSEKNIRRIHEEGILRTRRLPVIDAEFAAHRQAMQRRIEEERELQSREVREQTEAARNGEMMLRLFNPEDTEAVSS